MVSNQKYGIFGNVPNRASVDVTRNFRHNSEEMRPGGLYSDHRNRYDKEYSKESNRLIMSKRWGNKMGMDNLYDADRARHEQEMYEGYLCDESFKREEEDRIAEQLLAMRIAKYHKDREEKLKEEGNG